jgi:hypothetical protein
MIAIAPQARGRVAERCREIARDLFDLHLHERPDETPARTICVPGGSLGAQELFVQRNGRPITIAEILTESAAIASADILFVGPIPVVHDETVEMLKALPAMAPRGYHVLGPHPSLATHRRFAEVGRAYD